MHAFKVKVTETRRGGREDPLGISSSLPPKDKSNRKEWKIRRPDRARSTREFSIETRFRQIWWQCMLSRLKSGQRGGGGSLPGSHHSCLHSSPLVHSPWPCSQQYALQYLHSTTISLNHPLKWNMYDRCLKNHFQTCTPMAKIAQALEKKHHFQSNHWFQARIT